MPLDCDILIESLWNYDFLLFWLLMLVLDQFLASWLGIVAERVHLAYFKQDTR